MCSGANAGAPKEIFWEDLIPKGHVQIDTQAQANHEGSEQNWVQPDLDAPVVKELNGQSVSLPGFVVPLEGDSEVITEFLLVPYFGACIHVHHRRQIKLCMSRLKTAYQSKTSTMRLS